MISYTKTNVNSIILILTILVYMLFCLISKNVNAFNKQRSLEYTNEIQSNSSFNIEENVVIQNDIKANETNSENQANNIEIKDNWEITIPVINLKAPIQQGTTIEVMNKYVGHFETTSLWNGNVGLAAHNRGYPVNYFANIKSLKIGDEIIYKYGKQQREYQVTTITIITDEDWSYLQNTNDNKITLITCVENKPAYRRCIQATQIN